MKKGVSRKGVKKIKKSRKDIDLKKTLAYKLLKIFLIILLILLVVYIIVNALNEKDLEEDFGEEEGLGSFGIFEEGLVMESSNIIKENCSDENLKEIWSSLFYESSDDVVIVSNKNASENCNATLMYKILSNNMTYFSYISYQNEEYRLDGINYNFYGNFTEEFIENLQNRTSENVPDFLSDFLLKIMRKDYIQGVRNIANSTEANNEYQAHFKINNGTWRHDGLYDTYAFLLGSLSNGGNISSIYIDTPLDILTCVEVINRPIGMLQIRDIPNLIINESKMHSELLDLDDYFINLENYPENINFSYDISVPGTFIVSRNINNNTLNFNTSNTIGGLFSMNITLKYLELENVTSNNFNITINGCLDSDGGSVSSIKGTTQNLTKTEIDGCLSEETLEEFYCENQFVRSVQINCSENYSCSNGRCASDIELNHAPDFLRSECDDLFWEKDDDYEIDLDDCFEDDDDDDLVFRYYGRNNTNLSVARHGNNLTLTPSDGWIGSNYFYIYANDSYEETRGKVDFSVGVQIESDDDDDDSGDDDDASDDDEDDSGDDLFEIKSAHPSGSTIVIFSETNKSFSIGNTDYDTIQWYLNSVLSSSSSNSYDANGFGEGNYTIKVEIKKGNETVSKIWNLIVEGSVGSEPAFEVGVVLFWTILVVIIIVILLVVWLFIIEVSRKKNKTNLGFGVAQNY